MQDDVRVLGAVVDRVELVARGDDNLHGELLAQDLRLGGVADKRGDLGRGTGGVVKESCEHRSADVA